MINLDVYLNYYIIKSFDIKRHWQLILIVCNLTIVYNINIKNLFLNKNIKDFILTR